MTDTASTQRSTERLDNKPKRRQHSPEYKFWILQEIESSRKEVGLIGHNLRQKGLHADQVAIWRRDLEGPGRTRLGAPQTQPQAGPNREEVRHERDWLDRHLAKVKEANLQLRLIVAAQIIVEMIPATSEKDE